MVKCSYCHKELSDDECAVVYQGSKKTFYCPEHKGKKTEAQLFWDMVLDVLCEKELNRKIINKIRPFMQQYGSLKTSHFISNRKNFYRDLFYRKTFPSLDNKLDYFCAILKNELPDFQEPKVIKKEVRSFYEPEYDQSISKGITTCCKKRETVEERRKRLLSHMKEQAVSAPNEKIVLSKLMGVSDG